MDVTELKGITDYEVFKQKLIDFDNWRMNIDEDEEDMDDKCINYIQKNYKPFLTKIIKESQVYQLIQIAQFIYYVNY
jgi:hypothetical protein